MAQLTLFDEPIDDRPPLARRLSPRLSMLARQGIYFGTSSWKYPGWQGSIYSTKKYQVRGRFSLAKFEAECLSEYAETFPVVGGDFSFYQFPSRSFWDRLFGETPPKLLFGLKVPESVTVHTWPRHPRYGPRGGQLNDDFLNPEILVEQFLAPLAPHQARIAVLMLEFGAFSKAMMGSTAEFRERLGEFLGVLPGGYRFAVEIRNSDYLQPEYFSTLAAHGAAHVFNAWTRMPELGQQASLPGAFTTNFAVVRALLSRGRSYEQAVQLFEPYREVQQPNPAARAGLRLLVDRSRELKQPIFLFVNNRLEGNAPGTIEAVIESLEQENGGPRES